VVVDLDALVLREGDEVEAHGRLVKVRSGTWFEPPLPVRAMWVRDRRVAGPTECAVPVRGADFEDLEHRYKLDGSVEGRATVTGAWVGGAVQVTAQSPGARGPRVPHGRWVSPPCRAPRGGWPQGPPDLNFGVVVGRHDRRDVVAITTFRPSDTQAVLVVAATDVEGVEARRADCSETVCASSQAASRGPNWTIPALASAPDGKTGPCTS
jgi:hypothetical protein